MVGFLVQVLAIPESKPLRFPPDAGSHRVLVLRVVDGDTVHFAWLIEDTARLHGIDAPEVKGSAKLAGLASKAFLETLLSKEPMATEILGRDKYGRALMRFWTADGREIGKVMIDAGHAKIYP
jgi:endonuclease YncB( thermonuclease family)